jgi:hypothetical protein
MHLIIIQRVPNVSLSFSFISFVSLISLSPSSAAALSLFPSLGSLKVATDFGDGHNKITDLEKKKQKECKRQRSEKTKLEINKWSRSFSVAFQLKVTPINATVRYLRSSRV